MPESTGPRGAQDHDCHVEPLRGVKVVFLTDIPTPYVMALLKALARRVDLHVLFMSRWATRGMNWTLDGEAGFTHEFIEGATVRRGDAGGTDFYLSPRTLAALRRVRPAAVICAGFSFPTAYALAYCRMSGAKLLIYNDGTAYSERNYGFGRMAARKLLIPAADALIGKSGKAAERFIELGGAGKTFTAHHTTDLQALLDVGAQREALPDPAQDAALRLLSVGRLIERKGLHHLIAAIARLEPGIAGRVRLTIVGSGPDEGRLRGLAAALPEGRIVFAGFREPAELPAIYRDADVFVLPTLQDPFAIVLLEAAAAGLALLSSHFAGATHEFVSEGVTGTAFDPRNEEALAGKIAALAGDPLAVRRMGAEARAIALGRTPDRAAAAYVKALQHALKQG